MRRSYLPVVALLVSATLVTSTQAGWWGNFWGSVERDFHRNNCWPEPFIYQDRESTMAPFGPMIDKGWEHQNLLTDHHFEADSRSLSQAGKLKVQWILAQAPPQYRTVFVQRAADPNTTAVRVDTVQQTAASLVPMGELPQVVVSNTEDEGHSADYVDNVSRKFNSTVPDPRLPKESTDSGSGGK